MMRCQGQQYTREYQVISPTNGRLYQRAAGGYMTRCDHEAQVHVRLEFCDGMVVEKDICRDCAEEWQASVNGRFAYQKPLWTITPLTVEPQDVAASGAPVVMDGGPG